jgi:hypothetical protein
MFEVVSLRARRVFGSRCRLLLPCLVAGVFAALLIPAPPRPAAAQDFGTWFGGSGNYYPRSVLRLHRRTKPSRHAREDDEDETGVKKGKHGATAEKPVTGPLFAVLSIADQHISVYNSSGLVTRSIVSTGMPGHRTPMGIFSIIGRERWHNSNIYSGAPMPYMQRITWSGVAMHLGVVPGYPASHGCIRLPSGSAQRLWGMTKIGERVVISPREVHPEPISHPLLPVAKLQPSPAALADNTAPQTTEVATAGNAVTLAGPKLLNPIAYAQALKTRAAADVSATSKTVKELSERMVAKPEAVRRALTELRNAQAAHNQAEVKLAVKDKALAAARAPKAKQAAESAKAAAEAHLAEANSKLAAATANPTFGTPEGKEALEAESALQDARTALAKAQTLAKEAERRLSPVSILISKKDARVYVRQGLAPLLEAPAVIRNPEVPLGTHVYIASSQTDGQSLGWTVISMPSSFAGRDEPAPRRGREARHQVAHEEPVTSASNAAQALERVDIPKEVSERISELLWTGASLIISDQPLSGETSDVGTDLVVTMR